MIRLLLQMLPNLPRRLTALAGWQLASVGAEAIVIGLTIHVMSRLGREASAPSSAASSFGGLSELVGRWSVPMLLVAVAAATIVRLITQGAAVWLWARGVEAYEKLHRGRLLSALLRAEWSLQSREPSGRLQHLLTHHTECVSKAYTAVAWSLIHAVTCLMLVGAAFLSSPVTALVGAGFLVVCHLAVRPLAAKRIAAGRGRASALADYVHLVSQTAGLLRELRVFRAEQGVKTKADHAADLIGATRRTQNFWGSLLPAVHQAAAGFLLAAGLWWGYHNAAAGTAAVVSLVLLLRSASSLQHLHATSQQLHEVRPFLEEVAHTVVKYEQSRLPQGGLPISRIESVEFRDIGFAYENSQMVLAGVDCRWTRGEVVGIIGRSGAGKTTLVNLLLGLARPTSGGALLNGQAAELFSRDAFYSRIAYVPQEPAMFHESIAECIRFGRDQVSDAMIQQAVEDAGLADELRRMPAGLQTPVGERGTELSVGQRQRICLARALADLPDVIVLDEPTASLDTETEDRVIGTIRRLRGRAMVVVVTHRPAALGACDRVFEVLDGEVVERLSSRVDAPYVKAA
ncbi:MAG: ABC transporter ATP-binding protein [Pirellulales bacterium]